MTLGNMRELGVHHLDRFLPQHAHLRPLLGRTGRVGMAGMT